MRVPVHAMVVHLRRVGCGERPSRRLRGAVGDAGSPRRQHTLRGALRVSSEGGGARPCRCAHTTPFGVSASEEMTSRRQTPHESASREGSEALNAKRPTLTYANPNAHRRTLSGAHVTCSATLRPTGRRRTVVVIMVWGMKSYARGRSGCRAGSRGRRAVRCRRDLKIACGGGDIIEFIISIAASCGSVACTPRNQPDAGVTPSVGRNYVLIDAYDRDGQGTKRRPHALL